MFGFTKPSPWRTQAMKKPPFQAAMKEKRIERDSNPRYRFTLYTGLAIRPLQPLGHRSKQPRIPGHLHSSRAHTIGAPPRRINHLPRNCTRGPRCGPRGRADRLWREALDPGGRLKPPGECARARESLTRACRWRPTHPATIRSDLRACMRERVQDLINPRPLLRCRSRACCGGTCSRGGSLRDRTRGT